MSDTKIRIIVEGPSSSGHDVSLSEFGNVVNSCRKLLQHAAKSSLGGNKCDFLIRNASHNSPLCVEVQPHSLTARPGFLIAQQLRDEEEKIRSGNSDSLSDDTIRAWEDVVARYDKGKVSIIKIEADMQSEMEEKSLRFNADKEVIDAIKKARDQELSCLTSVMGDIELINLHNQGMLKVYPKVKHWNNVTVYFNDSQQQEVIKHVGRFVEVSGMGHYRPNDALPYKMQMDSIHLLPGKEDSPKFSAMRGIAPGLTGNQSTQDYIKNLRKEWDK